MRFFRTYMPFAKSIILEFMAYRMNFYVYILGDIMQTAVLLYIWLAIFKSSPNDVIHGFTYLEMVGYVVMSTLTGLLVSNDAHWAIGNDVRTGDIAMNLIKPVNYMVRQYFYAIGFVLANFMFVFLPLWIGYTIYTFLTGINGGFWNMSGQLISINFVQIGMYVISAFLSSVVLFFINFLFGLAAFYVEYIFGFIFAKEAIMRLLSGQLIPLVFFPVGVLAIFKYLPFAGLVYTPTMIYLGKYSGREMWENIGIQAVWVVLLFMLAQWLWNRAIKRLTILGG